MGKELWMGGWVIDGSGGGKRIGGKEEGGEERRREEDRGEEGIVGDREGREVGVRF